MQMTPTQQEATMHFFHVLHQRTEHLLFDAVTVAEVLMTAASVFYH
jgi:hypothetical protein